jgi:hypothetical protein
MRVVDLLKLVTRGDPLRPVFVLTASGAELALASSSSTGVGEVEIDGERVECIVISTVE